MADDATHEDASARPRLPATSAISMHLDSDSDDDDAGLSAASDASSALPIAASPGAGSYVTTADSWRGVPPPMLAGSFDARLRPSFRTGPARPRAAFAPAPRPPRAPEPAYGAVAADDAHAPAAPPPEDVRAREAARAASHAAAVSHARAHARGRAGAGAARPPASAKIASMNTQWRAIMGAPRELWIIFVLKFLSSYAYFSVALILTMFLTQEFGLSDSAAGWAYGLYGVMSTVFGFVCGWVIDYLGVRASLLVGAVVGAASRLVLAFTPSHRTALFMLYTALPFSECLGIPIMTIGIKRYTNSHNRTFSFSLFYSMMNVAALCAGPLVDLSRAQFATGLTLDLRNVGFEAVFELSALRVIVLSSSFAAAAMMFGVVAGIREIEVDDHGNVTRFEPDRTTNPYDQTMSVLRQKAFWRLTVFTLLIVGVRLVFRHLDATMPKYLTRQFGPTAPFGLVYSINPMLVIWMVPLVGLFTRHVASYDMILWGSLLSALSPFWICIGPHYWTVVLFMVTLSIGEAVYSPRVYEYTMEVSGRGVEGLYSSLASAPLFSVKLLVGGMSGWLLTSFMPADDPANRHGGWLWGIVGLTSLTSPLLMVLLRDFIAPPTPEEQQQRTMRSKASSYASLDIDVVDSVTLPPANMPRGQQAQGDQPSATTGLLSGVAKDPLLWTGKSSS